MADLGLFTNVINSIVAEARQTLLSLSTQQSLAPPSTNVLRVYQNLMNTLVPLGEAVNRPIRGVQSPVNNTGAVVSLEFLLTRLSTIMTQILAVVTPEAIVLACNGPIQRFDVGNINSIFSVTVPYTADNTAVLRAITAVLKGTTSGSYSDVGLSNEIVRYYHQFAYRQSPVLSCLSRAGVVDGAGLAALSQFPFRDNITILADGAAANVAGWAISAQYGGNGAVSAIGDYVTISCPRTGIFFLDPATDGVRKAVNGAQYLVMTNPTPITDGLQLAVDGAADIASLIKALTSCPFQDRIADFGDAINVYAPSQLPNYLMVGDPAVAVGDVPKINKFEAVFQAVGFAFESLRS